MHGTSLINALFLSIAATYVLASDGDLVTDSWEDRLWNYTGACGMVQAFGVGYFLWDLQVCIVHFDLLSWENLVHAIVAVIITMLGYVCIDSDSPNPLHTR